MERNLGLKRKAQELQAAGRLGDALREWDRILGEAAEADPYDHVTVGDLYLRMGQRDRAREHYEKACSAYRNLGFIRNAIGVTKKILRTGGDTARIHYLLGSLYLADGLIAEATEHCSSYLAAYAEGDHPLDDTIQLLEAAREKGSDKPEFSYRLAELYERRGRNSEAADELLRLADRIPESGGPYEPQTLRKRAQKLDPAAAASVSSVDVEAEVPGVDAVAGGGDAPAADAVGIEGDPTGAGSLGIGGELPGDGSEGRAEAPSTPEPYRPPGFEPSPAPSAPVPQTPDGLKTAHASPTAEDVSWSEAVDELGALLEEKGCQQHFLEKLVEACRDMGNTKLTVAALDKLVRYFDQKGDTDQATRVRQEILSLDPEHPQALQGGVEDWSPQFVVAEDKLSPPQAAKLKIEELLGDFQEEMARQIPEDDGESHYALALSHYEMGLYDTALESLERALASSGVGPDLELRCRELQERCNADVSESGEEMRRSGGSEVA